MIGLPVAISIDLSPSRRIAINRPRTAGVKLAASLQPLPGRRVAVWRSRGLAPA
ncbi:MAG TPA: hypothetical protein VFT05_11865 [Burkholderiaceae bacterium]|nr:hypothetical protein [Burkholderiaceae bacterium]